MAAGEDTKIALGTFHWQESGDRVDYQQLVVVEVAVMTVQISCSHWGMMEVVAGEDTKNALVTFHWQESGDRVDYQQLLVVEVVETSTLMLTVISQSQRRRPCGSEKMIVATKSSQPAIKRNND